jgi:hypothetical protein
MLDNLELLRFLSFLYCVNTYYSVDINVLWFAISPHTTKYNAKRIVSVKRRVDMPVHYDATNLVESV